MEIIDANTSLPNLSDGLKTYSGSHSNVGGEFDIKIRLVTELDTVTFCSFNAYPPKANTSLKYAEEVFRPVALQIIDISPFTVDVIVPVGHVINYLIVGTTDKQANLKWPENTGEADNQSRDYDVTSRRLIGNVVPDGLGDFTHTRILNSIVNKQGSFVSVIVAKDDTGIFTITYSDPEFTGFPESKWTLDVTYFGGTGFADAPAYVATWVDATTIQIDFMVGGTPADPVEGFSYELNLY